MSRLFRNHSFCFVILLFLQIKLRTNKTIFQGASLLYGLRKSKKFTKGWGAQLPAAYKKFWDEWKLQQPAAVHYVPKDGKLMSMLKWPDVPRFSRNSSTFLPFVPRLKVSLEMTRISLKS